MKEKIIMEDCSKTQLVSCLEQLLREIKEDKVALGYSTVNLSVPLRMKMELEERDGGVEFELELKWTP